MLHIQYNIDNFNLRVFQFCFVVLLFCCFVFGNMSLWLSIDLRPFHLEAPQPLMEFPVGTIWSDSSLQSFHSPLKLLSENFPLIKLAPAGNSHTFMSYFKTTIYTDQVFMTN